MFKNTAVWNITHLIATKQGVNESLTRMDKCNIFAIFVAIELNSIG